MLRIRLISRVLGALMAMIGAAMVVPWLLALWEGRGEHYSFLVPILMVAPIGLVLWIRVKPRGSDELSHREAFVIASLGWVVAAFVAALPYWLYGMFGPWPTGKPSPFPTFTLAYFESISGLTTTGGTVLPYIDPLPMSMLLWRSLTHWLGGMGILLLGVAILPFLGIGGMQLYRAEVPGPTADKLSPRIAETAKRLWLIYIVLTFAQAICLWLCGMTVFDAICHSFATIATGGFSTKGISVEAFHSVTIEMVILFFMFLAGVNFALHFSWLRGNFKPLWKNEEFRFYCVVTAVWTLAIAISLRASHYYDSIWKALRYSSFQVVSLLTSTGFSSTNFDDWRVHAAGNGAHASMHAVFWVILLMFIGGSAGSTGGGVKCIRVWLLLKAAYRELIRLIHPRIIKPITLGGKAVSEPVLSAIVGFFALYMVLVGVCSLMLTAFGLDLLSAFTAVAACVGNIGPGFAKVGPYQNFASIHPVAQWILIFCMLLGRLELYTVLILLVPAFWRK
jgi:trk system potassium uptake protein TrkH